MITQEEFNAKMAELAGGPLPKAAAALSGGADSMAMAILAGEWAKTAGAEITALTVDHGLRPESAEEAKKVHGWAETLGIPHEILTYRGKIPASNVEAAARKYRYRMLLDYCRENGIGAMLVAHNRDEQAETFLLNLARGSGVMGLAAMPGASVMEGVRILRPMLSFPKDEIKEYLESRGQEWVEDPSNKDTRYKRARIRKLKGVLDELGLSSARIGATIENMARAREAIEFFVRELAERAVAKEAGGSVAIDAGIFKSYPEEVGMRMLALVLKSGSDREYPPRLASLEKIYRGIAEGTLGKGATLHGFKISLMRGQVLIARENRGKKKYFPKSK